MLIELFRICIALLVVCHDAETGTEEQKVFLLAFQVLLVYCRVLYIMAESNSRSKNSNHPSSGDPSFDLMFKVLIIGNAGVGKTATIFRYCDNTFVSGYVSTVGIDFKVKTVPRQEKKVKLQIWDTAGQERFRSITHAYYRGAMGFLLMFDLTNEDSFTSVREW